MKCSTFTEEQIIGILKEHQAEMSVVDLCRKHGIFDATFYKWRSKYGGMEVSDAKLLDNSTLKEMLGKNFRRLVQGGTPCRVALHRTRKTDTERLC